MCKEETNNECRLESLAKNIWSQVYPERRKWNELEQSTKDEWIRFTKVAKKVISRQQ
jgi:HEPN domain-containing protein